MAKENKPVLESDVIFNLGEVNRSGLLGYRSEALPTWCPGCGYFGITLAITKALNSLKIENKNLVVVTGIGCAGRFPFFLKGYGFHTTHGRALPVASGVKMANPELTVIVIGGDGDGLAIGGGHLPHASRRNVDITYILFDNEIYGLTKGQSSPTTPKGQVTGTHPYGNPDNPINPLAVALSYGASFVGHGYAGEPEPLTDVITQAIAHKGFSFVTAISPCVTFDHNNIIYDRLRELWKPVPADHPKNDLGAAMTLAMKNQFMQGVFYKSEGPTWDDVERETASRAKEHATKSD